ncbi:MAG: enoyl-CoA hydratase/isomerase family protein [bacterium]|jgi:enoyl-CoA hydratase
MREVVLEGPGKNALGSALMRQLLDALRSAAGEAVLLRGAGDAFCAGLNLKEMAALDAAGMRGFLALLEDMVQALYEYPGPTAAAVNGHAVAGGCVLALGCDWRVMTAAAGARIGLNEIAIGARFPPHTWAMVKARVPAASLERVVLGAQLVDPQTALGLGLVDELADEPLSRAKERLAVLAGHPRDAYAVAKRGIRGVLAPGAEALARWEGENLAAWTSPQFRSLIERQLKR